MATDEHKELAYFIKEVHSKLRSSTLLLGPKKAWSQHCENSKVLKEYAKCMQTLATTHWESNCANDASDAISRIKWVAEFCLYYFTNESIYISKEIVVAKKLDLSLSVETNFQKPYKLLDVGSCYNPFKVYDYLDVCAIDLCPANSSVYECDYINVNIGSENVYKGNKLVIVKQESFDVVTFCFVLEYLPSSELRLTACYKAYQTLKKGGLLFIITPDSKHVGANCKIMKCWRYTLSCIGFNRIKYEKFPHMHCMAFRKTLDINIAKRWAVIHNQCNLDIPLPIPQDYQHKEMIKHVIEEKKTKQSLDFEHNPLVNVLLENDDT